MFLQPSVRPTVRTVEFVSNRTNVIVSNHTLASRVMKTKTVRTLAYASTGHRHNIYHRLLTAPKQEIRSPKTVLYLIVVRGEQPSRGMPGGAMPSGVKAIGRRTS